MTIVFDNTAQKMKFSIQDFSSECDQIRGFVLQFLRSASKMELRRVLNDQNNKREIRLFKPLLRNGVKWSDIL